MPDVARDEIPTPRGGCSHHRGAGVGNNRDAKAGHLWRSVALWCEHLEAPRAELAKGDLRQVGASYRRFLRMRMTGAIGMEMPLQPLLDDF
jgi:hypothetical protein